MNWYGRKIKAETAEELAQLNTPNGIRKRLCEASMHDPIVRRVFDLAHREGLSGEDTYALMAYHALVEKQHFEELLLDDYNSRLTPMIVARPADSMEAPQPKGEPK